MREVTMGTLEGGYVRCLGRQPPIEWTTRYHAWVLAWAWLPSAVRRWLAPRLPYIVSLFIHHEVVDGQKRQAWYTNVVMPSGWIVAQRLWKLDP